jgi:hypothetical protein
MVDVSNANNCENGTSTNYEGYYFVTFKLAEDGLYAWELPMDFGWGGFVTMDDEQVSASDDFSDATVFDFHGPLAAGEHMIEMYGSSAGGDTP